MDRTLNRLVLSFQERQDLRNVVFGWPEYPSVVALSKICVTAKLNRAMKEIA
jgi:hypothetical protein